MTKRKIWISALAASVLAAGGAWWYWKRGGTEVEYRYAMVERGPIQVSVTATGTLQALVTVQVGTQVSGPIASIHADFNSEVKKGQVIARLDTTLLHAALQDAKSNLARVSALEHQAAGELKRTKALFERALVSQAELDQAMAEAQVAAANLSSVQSQVERARINLRYAIITSPIDGTILSRAVDVGQTVAASFNTPTLFTIAGDLREMEVKAAVDEADIGKIRMGQKAAFTVDAYPEASFNGTVQQVRLEPKVEQNVVTYDVVIRVPNPDKKLMPGMTANLTIAVTEKEDVLLVPSSALRFRPPGDTGSGRGRRNKERNGDASSPHTAQAAEPGSPGPHGATATVNGDRPRGEGGTGPEGVGRKGRIFVLGAGDKPEALHVKVGVSDGSRTEIEGSVRPGALVIVGIESGAETGARNGGSPFGLAPRGGGSRRAH